MDSEKIWFLRKGTHSFVCVWASPHPAVLSPLLCGDGQRFSSLSARGEEMERFALIRTDVLIMKDR